jgi:uncharacterized cupredoxin-like copper-binding protein
MRTLVRFAAAAAVAASTAVGGYAVDAHGEGPAPLGPGLVTVELRVHHSRFAIDTLHVRPGTVVQFIVRNDDPINHELVVGDDAVHARHRRGSERAHPPVPGEVSLAPLETGVTFYRFDTPGTVTFACHLPGHFAYGMRGTVVVTPG